MPPRGLCSEKMPTDALRMLRTIGINRASVRCKNCRTRLTWNARVIRDHLQYCAAALVITSSSQEVPTTSFGSGAPVIFTSTGVAAAADAVGPNKSSSGNSGSNSSSIEQSATSTTASAAAATTSSTTTTTTTSNSSSNSTAPIMKVEPPKELFKPLQLPQRILTGPGPSNCSQRVLRALQQQVLGHMHPEVLQLMDEIKAGLRYAFQTANKLTLAISASGHAGMEASIGNVLERGENILIVKAGLWGERAADMAARLGIHADLLETEPGVAFTPDQLEEAVKKYRPTAVFVAHSESSTGLKQPLEGLGDVVHKYGGLLIVDTVASLGAEPFFADAWGVDVVYTGSQKVLGAPAGITPISFSPLAEKKLLLRKTPVPVFYWDMTWLGRYWNCFENQGPRPYHHTISATLVYGLREALAQLAEEGLAASWARHASVTDKFHEGLLKRGYSFFVREPRHRLKTVSAIILPSGINGALVIRYAMERYNVEISGGLGPSAGKVIRIGLMGVNATSGHVDLVLRALDEAMKYAKEHFKSNM